MKVIHMKWQSLPEALEIRDSASVGYLADKHKVLYIIRQLRCLDWTSQHEFSQSLLKDVRDRELTVYIAWTFGYSENFKTATGMMIRVNMRNFHDQTKFHPPAEVSGE